MPSFGSGDTMILDKSPTDRLRQRLTKDAHCPRCGYTLKDLTDIRCPECGFVLAAELITTAQKTTRPIVLWAHRILGASATILLLTLVTRCILATLKNTPRPSMLAFVPLFACLSIWLMQEFVNAYLPPEHKRPKLNVLLGVISAIGLYSACFWMLK